VALGPSLIPNRPAATLKSKIMGIEYAKENQAQPKTTADIICPKCYKLLPQTNYTEFASTDRYRTMRSYFGWCIQCQLGCEVVQFKQRDKWHIHKYRFYATVVSNDKPVPDKNWHIINELPESAPVVTGPGGNYNRQITPEIINIIKSLQNILESTAKTTSLLLKILGVK